MTSYTIAVYLFTSNLPLLSTASFHPIQLARLLYRCAHSMAWVPLNQLVVHWTVYIIWMLVFASEWVCMINAWNIHPKRLWWNQNNSSTSRLVITSGRIKFRYIRYQKWDGGKSDVLGCACMCASFLFGATHMYCLLFLWYFTFIFVQI